MAARIGVGLVATLVLAWLGVMERDVRLLDRGIEASGQLRTAGSFERAEADLRGARLLNPDPRADLGRAVLYQGAGRLEQAAVLLEEVVRREPDNGAAWGQLLALTRERDPARAARALAAVRRLDPLNARRR
jgi:tetratricopeptide (TPR) repeat protein